jgi:hypothetical protein
MSYLDSHEYQNFWGKSGAVDLIQKGLTSERVEQISDIINGDVFETRVSDRIDGDDLKSGFRNDRSFYSLLIQTGYLTYDDTETEDNYFLKTPNVELNNVWKDFILDNLYNLNNLDIYKTLDAVSESNIFEALLRELLSDRLSYFDFDKPEPEKTYHVYVAGLFAGVGLKFKSNREAGNGRYDIFINYKGANYIFEFKKVIPPGTSGSVLPDPNYIATPDDLEAATTNAVQQIRDKNYASELDNNDPTYLVGIGFWKKQNLVKVESL